MSHKDERQVLIKYKSKINVYRLENINRLNSLFYVNTTLRGD